MPRRTNTFQQVVKLVYELMADNDATVEESAMLPDRDTDGKREVDVLVTGQIAGVPMRIQIEATAQAEPVTLLVSSGDRTANVLARLGWTSTR